MMRRGRRLGKRLVAAPAPPKSVTRQRNRDGCWVIAQAARQPEEPADAAFFVAQSGHRQGGRIMPALAVAHYHGLACRSDSRKPVVAG